MPKYLARFSYTRDGLEGLVKEGAIQARHAGTPLQESSKHAGGTLEAFYYAFGDHDLYAIVDVPDNETMAAIMLAVGASGSSSGSTTVLLTPEEVDAAVNREIAYTPPGRDDA